MRTNKTLSVSNKAAYTLAISCEGISKISHVMKYKFSCTSNLKIFVILFIKFSYVFVIKLLRNHLTDSHKILCVYRVGLRIGQLYFSPPKC